MAASSKGAESLSVPSRSVHAGRGRGGRARRGAVAGGVARIAPGARVAQRICQPLMRHEGGDCSSPERTAHACCHPSCRAPAAPAAAGGPRGRDRRGGAAPAPGVPPAAGPAPSPPRMERFRRPRPCGPDRPQAGPCPAGPAGLSAPAACGVARDAVRRHAPLQPGCGRNPARLRGVRPFPSGRRWRIRRPPHRPGRRCCGRPRGCGCRTPRPRADRSRP